MRSAKPGNHLNATFLWRAASSWTSCLKSQNLQSSVKYWSSISDMNKSVSIDHYQLIFLYSPVVIYSYSLFFFFSIACMPKPLFFFSLALCQSQCTHVTNHLFTMTRQRCACLLVLGYSSLLLRIMLWKWWTTLLLLLVC